MTDGDTIKVLDADKQLTKVRLAGIDCPERGQPYGRVATDAAAALVAGKTVEVEVVDTDRYGRTVGRVYVDGNNVNRALVNAGHCWAYTRYVRDKMLFTLQDDARKAQRGLWRLPAAERMPPWEWRRKGKSKPKPSSL
ncbi:thermonuclease family protein [Microbulbifer taiwanensis]|uniref:thermonuclease family protein n=1 Tax=Microbulbifer taiwanensis TaxID=986746 RepID=UPI00360D62D7